MKIYTFIKSDENIHFYIQKGHYNDLKIGEKTTLKFNAGKFGISWRFESFINKF